MRFNHKYCFPYKDNFNIYNKIKKINKSYSLFINKKDNCFLIVNTAKNNEICCNFDNFNQNVENLLNLTKVENSINLFSLIENNNEKINKLKQQSDLSKSQNILKEAYNYLNRTNKSTTEYLNKLLKEYKC